MRRKTLLLFIGAALLLPGLALHGQSRFTPLVGRAYKIVFAGKALTRVGGAFSLQNIANNDNQKWHFPAADDCKWRLDDAGGGKVYLFNKGRGDA